MLPLILQRHCSFAAAVNKLLPPWKTQQLLEFSHADGKIAGLGIVVA